MVPENGKSQNESVISLNKLVFVRLEKTDKIEGNIFSDKEKAKIHFYVREEDQLLKAASILLLDEFVGESISYNEFGKPYRAEGSYFSLSHSYPFLALAISPSPIGADVEKEKEWESKMNQFCFSKDEMNSKIKPLTLWCLKEASYKVSGDHPFEPKDEEIKDLNDSSLTYREKRYYFKILSDSEKELVIVSSGVLDAIKMTIVSYHDLVEQRRLHL